MMKKTTTLGILIAILIISSAFKRGDHKNFFKSVEPFKHESYTMEFDNMIATKDYCKFAVRVFNKTSDYILYKYQESSVTLDGKNFSSKQKEIIVNPKAKKGGTYNVNGEHGDYHVDAFSFNIDGLYLIPSNGTVADAPNFHLPASQRDIEFGNFKVTMKKMSKETKITQIAFEVQYLGEDFAIVDENKLVVTIPEKGEQEFANEYPRADSKILRPGKKITLRADFQVSAKYADMQFANMEILWKNTFRESSAQKLSGGKVDFVLDPGMTEAKN